MSGDTKKSCPATNSEDAIVWAAENGLDVILPTAWQLLLDIDRPSDRDEFEKNRDIIDSVYGIVGINETQSRSGNTHLIVTLQRAISPLERIAIQAVLGSDRRREAHSIRRFTQGEESPTLFFRKRT